MSNKRFFSEAEQIWRGRNVELASALSKERALNSDLLAALKDAGSWLAFVRKGITAGHIKDQTVLNTTGDGASLPMTPLSQVLDRQIASVSSAIKAAEKQSAGEQS